MFGERGSHAARSRGGAVVLGLLGAGAHAEPPGLERLTDATLRTLLVGLGYHPRDGRNESGADYEITLTRPEGWAIATRVMLSRDGTMIWFIAWLKKIPAGRTISGNAVLSMLVENDAIGPTHFSYNEGNRWFFLNKPLVNLDVTPARVRGELDHLARTVARTQALWDYERWR